MLYLFAPFSDKRWEIVPVKAKYLVCFGRKEMQFVRKIDHCFKTFNNELLKALPNPVSTSKITYEIDENRGGNLTCDDFHCLNLPCLSLDTCFLLFCVSEKVVTLINQSS